MSFFINYLVRKKVIIVISLCFIISFFTIPYLFPPSKMVTSTSFDYGFNNQIGIVLVFVSVALFCFLGYKGRDKEIPVFSYDTGTLHIINYIVGVVFFALFIIIASSCGEFLLYYGFDSCSYFIFHLYEMSYGSMPYKDFCFFYGPLMLYFPYCIFSLFPAISIVNAYLLSLFFFHVFGLYALYELINSLNISKRGKKIVYWASYLLFFPIALGMNYESLRFVFPFWAFWRLNKVHHSKWQIFLFPLSVILSMAVSPEIGVVYFIILLIYGVLHYLKDYNNYYLYSLFSTLLAGSLFFYLFFPMFSMAASFGGGYYNFPFIPSLHLLVFFICIFILSYHGGGICRRWQKNVFEICFILLAIGLIPACLGRCDIGHVLFNGFFIFCIVTVLLIIENRIYEKMLLMSISLLVVMMSILYYRNVGIFYIVSPVLNNIGFFYKHKTSIIKCTSFLGLPESIVDQKIDSLFINYNHFSPSNDLSLLPSDKSISFPVANSSVEREYLDLMSEGRLENLYFTRSSDLGTPNIQIMINEIDKKKVDILLLEKGWEHIIDPSDEKQLISSVFYSYYPLSPTRNGNLVHKPLVDYIKEHYYLSLVGEKYDIYRRKNNN